MRFPCLLLSLATALATAGDLPRPKEFLNEELFGPTNIHGMVGGGRVTAGISARGEVTVLRWPTPSQFDQLGYATRPGPGSRDLPRMGAGFNQGLVLGIAATSPTGERSTRWLRDPSFSHELGYAAEDGGVLVDRAVDAETGFAAEVRYGAPLGMDLLVIEVAVTRRPGSAWTDPALVVAERFAPTRRSLPYLPLYDVVVEDPDLLDFDARHQALVHRRARRELDPFAGLGRDATPDALRGLAGQDARAGFLGLEPEPEGPVLVLAGDAPVRGFQCGPVERRFWPRAADAFVDALDGKLSGKKSHRGRSTGALAFDLPATGRVGLFLALGRTPAEAAAALAAGREAGAGALLAALDERWKARMAGARLPTGIDARERAVLLRTLISILQSQDPESGMIVASISTQPPYAQDWPRDGAFLDLVLDLAGFHDEVTAHRRFYAKVQRREDAMMNVPGASQPKGTFEMSYYADGRPGGPFVFEIDNTALTVWSFLEHARFLAKARGPAAGRAYLEEVWPAIEAGTAALAAWRDPATGLHKPANEDDVPQRTQLLQGASTVHLALRAGIEAATELGRDPALIAAWTARRAELGAAILEHLWTPEAGFDKRQGPGPVGWLAWPVAFLPVDDPRMRAEADYLANTLERRLAGDAGGGAYEQKQLMALVSLVGHDPAWRPRLEAAYRIFVDRMPTPGTLHFGETYVTRPGAGGLEYENRTSIPHVWAAALVYLSSWLVHEGDLAP